MSRPDMSGSILPLYRRPSARETAAPSSVLIVQVKFWSYCAVFVLVLLTAWAAFSTGPCVLSSSSCNQNDPSVLGLRSLQALPEVSWSFLHGAAGQRDAVLHVHNLCSSQRHDVLAYVCAHFRSSVTISLSCCVSCV